MSRSRPVLSRRVLGQVAPTIRPTPLGAALLALAAALPAGALLALGDWLLRGP